MEDVKNLIPHREPFLFVDSIEEITHNNITAKRLIREDEVFFKGHYPGNPIMPGVLLCESMLQTGALLMANLMKESGGGVPVVTRVNNIKFKKMVKPGDTIYIYAQHTETLSGAYCFKGKVKVNGKLCTSCDFICTLVKEV